MTIFINEGPEVNHALWTLHFLFPDAKVSQMIDCIKPFLCFFMSFPNNGVHGKKMTMLSIMPLDLTHVNHYNKCNSAETMKSC